MIFCRFFIFTLAREYLFFDMNFSFNTGMFLHDILDKYLARRAMESVDMVGIFLHSADYSFFVLIRNEFDTTETLENAIARPAKIGLSNQPKRG